MKKKLLKTSLGALMGLLIVLFSTTLSAQTVQTFSSSGSWTCPAGVTLVTVETWGGGGAGGGLAFGLSAGAGAGGGGGGSYSKSVVTVVPGTSYPYVVGAGGTGTTAGGAAGGASSFNGMVTAAGGTGGATGPSGAKGIGASGSDYDGGDGFAGTSGTRSGAGGGGAGSAGSGGDALNTTGGAAGTTGGGAGAAGRTTTGTGNAGAVLSGGGSGAYTSLISTGLAGGSGAKGQVSLTYCTSVVTNSVTISASSPTSINWASLAWSQGHTPLPCEDVLLILDRSSATGTATETFTVNLASFTCRNFTMRNISNVSKQILFSTSAGSALNIVINGDLSIEAAGGASANIYNRTAFGLGNSSKITIYGDVILGRDGSLTTAREGMATLSGNPSTWVMYGDMIFNPRGYTTNRGTVFTFNKAGTSYLTNNTRAVTTDTSQAVLFETLNIGTTNATTVVMNGISYDSYISRLVNGIINIGTNSTLDMPENYSLNLTGTPMGSPQLNMAAGSLLRLGGDQSVSDPFGTSYGLPGSNFPNRLVPNFNATSTVEYYGRSGITQTIYNVPAYANLIASNGPGTGRAPKITTGALTVNTSFNINALADVTLGTSGSTAQTVASAGPLNINATGGLYCNDNLVSGAGAFTMGNGSYLGMGNSLGISTPGNATGNIRMTGGRTYNTTGNYIYNGLAAQITGNGLPATCNDLFTDNATTVTIANSQTVTGVNYLKQGIFDIGLNNKITITGNGTLNSITGKMKANLGLLDMNGSSGTAQSLAGSWFVNRNISTLVNSNTKGITIAATAGDTLLISSALLYGPSTTNSTITTNNNLTLLSRDSSTARFGEIVNLSGNSIVGNVTVEKYIRTSRKWRHLAWPTNSTQTAKQSWMENAATPNANPNSGYGTIVTDEKATWSANGFDSRSVSGPSVKYYDPINNNYIGIPNTGSYAMNGQSAYFNYIRGDRSCTPANSTTSPTILRTTGTLKTGNQVFTITATKFGAVGNPYASAIDLRKIDTLNLTSTFYVWDPKLSGGYGLGAYQTVYASGTNYLVSPGGGSYGAAGTLVDTLESGQAMYVRSKASAGTLTFKESAKTIGSRTMNKQEETTPTIFALLSLTDPAPAENTLVDGVLAVFEPEYSAAVDYDDALKMTNTSENVSLKRDGQLLSLERRGDIVQNDTLFINIAGMRIHSYQWDIKPDHIDHSGRTAFLIDKYLNTSTALDLTTTTPIAFDVISDAGSYAADRFMIVFKQQAPALVLPVRFTSLSAARNADKTVTVKYNTQNEVNIQNYNVQYSTNGTAFTTIGTQLPTANNGTGAAYIYLDGHATSGYNYYRIQGNSTNGQVQYSAIAKVGPLSETAGMSIYPNPVSGGSLNIHFENQPKGEYTVKVTNKLGQLIQTETVQVQNSNTIQTVHLDPNTAFGSYQATITDASGRSTTIPFVVQ